MFENVMVALNSLSLNSTFPPYVLLKIPRITNPLSNCYPPLSSKFPFSHSDHHLVKTVFGDSCISNYFIHFLPVSPLITSSFTSIPFSILHPSSTGISASISFPTSPHLRNSLPQLSSPLLFQVYASRKKFISCTVQQEPEFNSEKGSFSF